jgi:protein SCO1
VLTGCGEPRERSAGGYAGVELEHPKPLPPVVLTDLAGRPFDLRAGAAGRVTLLFFGYTHCPDICPVHMANLAAVLRQLPDEVSRRIRVVFVTTDPGRDTPARLARWLGDFSPEFIGLTGSPKEIARAQAAAGITAATVPDSAGSREAYAVSHAAQVLAYTPDGLGRVAYPAGTRQVDWAHDLPLLVQAEGVGR